MRAHSDLFGCVGTILVGGTFSDIYLPHNQAAPMACFSYVAILETVTTNPSRIHRRNHWLERDQRYQRPRKYTSFFLINLVSLRETRGICGLPYISLCIGVTIALIFNWFLIKKYEAIMESNGRKFLPESRLYGAILGAGFFPLEIFIYSVTQYGYIPWITSTIALAPSSTGICLIFVSTYFYTFDCYAKNSIIAGQGLIRNTLGGVALLFSSQFFHNVGSQYAGLIWRLLGRR